MPNPLTLFRNVALPTSATSGQTSTVGEPSLANNGAQVYYSGNWYAARSLDAAASWTYVNPFTTFPAADGGFCCDQTLIYDPTRNITIWLLQYVRISTNTLRVAVKKGTGGGLFDFFHDLIPGNVNPAWAAEWFDYNSAALSNNYLYITTNSFNGNAWQRSVVFRISLDSLAAGGALSYNFFSTTDNGSLRCTLGARDTMYFGSHNSSSQLRVFAWPESSTTVTFNDVNVTPWDGSRGAYNAPGPDGRNWLTRTDGRITGAFLANGVIGFLWTANTQAGRPQPYVRAVRIDAATKALASEPDIWNSTFAYAYPDVCTNVAGGVGITLFRGGGPIFPTHVVGVWQNPAWVLADTKAGTSGPQDGKWGDYVTCRRHAPDGVTFIASGFTLQGGALRSDIEPRYVHFGGNTVVNIASVAFPGVFLRMDGNGVTHPTGPGGGIVNCQFTAGPWEKFTLEMQADNTIAIASVQFPGVYLRMDGNGVTHPIGPGGGIVNCQFGLGPWEKFRIETQSDGTVAIASAQFPGVYLRIDGSGVTHPTGPGAGIVNCQFTAGPWEKFNLVPV